MRGIASFGASCNGIASVSSQERPSRAKPIRRGIPATLAIAAEEREFGIKRIVSMPRPRSSLAKARLPRIDSELDLGLNAILTFAYGSFSNNASGPVFPTSVNSSKSGNEAIARKAGVAMHASPIQFGRKTHNLIVR
jgi:hypothetical protein